MCASAWVFLAFNFLRRGIIVRAIPYPFKIVLACCALIITGLGIPVNCAGLFYASVSNALDVSIGALSVYITIQYAVAGVSLPLAGKLLQARGARSVLTVAVIMDSAAFGLLCFAQSIWAFYAAGVFLGVGSAFLIYLAIPVLITNWFERKTGLAMGISFSAAGIASALASPLITWSIAQFGWRPTYGACGLVMAAISLPFTLFIVRSTPAELGLKPYGAGASAASTVLTAGMRLKNALRTPSFYCIFLFAGLIGITSAFLFHLPACMGEYGFTQMQAASILSAAVIGITCGKLGIGWLNDLLGVKWAAPIGVGLGLIGMVLLISHLAFVPSLVGGLCYGIGFACTVLEPPPLVKRIFGMADYGVIYACIMTFSALGCAFGATLIGAVRDMAQGYGAALTLLIVLQAAALTAFAAAIITGIPVQRRWSAASSQTLKEE